jgi:hypothetical protein
MKDTPIHMLQSILCSSPNSYVRLDKLEEIQWKEAGQERFVQIVMRTSLARDACLGRVRELCVARGWHMVKGRCYATRARGRSITAHQKGSAPKSRNRRRIRVEDYYGPLSVPSSPKEADTEVAVSSPENLPKVGQEEKGRYLIGSFNVQGNINRKIHELEEYANRHRFDLIALQEVHKVKRLSVRG